MKQKITSLLTLLVMSFGIYAQDISFYTDQVLKAEPGGELTLTLNMRNSIPICGWDFRLYLPDGVSVLTELDEYDEPVYGISLPSRQAAADQTPETEICADGSLLIISTSAKKNFKGDDGEMVSIKLKVDENITVGTKSIGIRNISFADLDVKSFSQDDFEIPLTIFSICNVSAKSANEAMGSVTIDGGGEAVESGSKVTVTATPATGYEFLNWTVGETVVSTENPYSFTVSKDAALVANFSTKMFNVSFDVDGQVTTESLEFGSVIPTPQTPSKTGYTFAGWDPEFIAGTTVPAKDLSYKATWTVNQYTITFDTDGGTEIAPITQDFGTDITAPVEPSKTGYTFMGWSEDIPATMPAGNKVFKAKWQINSYKVTFVSDGVEVSAKEQNYGSVITAPANLQKEGHTFAGWEPEFKEGTTVPAEDVTYTAKWTVNKYTITFDTDGGTEIAPITQDFGTDITAPGEPSKTGYTFVGWSEEIPATMPAKDLNLTAKWQINSYDVVFVVDGEEVSRVTQEYGTPITAPEVQDKVGHTFAGWDPEFKEGTTVPAEDVTYTAKWTVNKYTITFDTDGGIEMAPITQDFGSAITVPGEPTKEGHTFMGWDREIPATMPAENITIKASWKINSYKVIFVVDGVEVSNVTQEYGTVITAPADPVKTGHEFAGWSPQFKEGATVPGNDVTYTAIWSTNKYTITFDTDGGTEIASITQSYGTEVTRPADPVKTGYTFMGWSEEIPATMPATDMNIKAIWQINSYKVVFVVDGVEVSNVTQEYGTVITAPKAPEKEGHTFAGWDPEFKEGTTVPADNVTYTAMWTVNKYTITFDTDGGSEIAPITQDYGTTITAPAAPLKEGHTFTGWDKEIPATMPATDLKLTATWQINSYDVVFVVDGEEVSRVTQEYGTPITAPADPVKDGYIFDGWDPEFVEGATVPEGGVTYTALWLSEEYVITFDSNGGSYVAPIVQRAGTPIVAPADPKREYYIFKGWSQEIPEVMPKENLTLVAQWEIDSKLVKVDMGLFLSGVDIVEIPEADEVIMQEVPYDYGQIVKAYEEARAAHRTISGEALYAAYLKAQKDLTAYMDYCYENGNLKVYEYTLDESWGTLILPFQYVAPEGWTFYSVSAMLEEGDNLLKLDVAESVSANTPYLVNGPEGKKILFVGHVKSNVKDVTEGMLTGVQSRDYTPQPGDYVLQTNEDGTGFYRVEDASQTQTVGVARCYLTLPADMEQFDVVYVERLTTSIDGVASQDEDAPIFNVAGQRKVKLSHGINIVGGKIIICK